jgi:Icc-related predicted phosphoesterase
MKIQYFSDIHLEFGGASLTATDADVVVAAGDIGVGIEGVEWLKASGKPTIYVAGNHEFYGGDLVNVQDAMRTAVNGSAVRYLECGATEIDGARFLGATLWTDYLGEDPLIMQDMAEAMNDFQQIAAGGRPLQPSDLVEINRATRSWLETRLAAHHAGPTVVVTHHAPLFASWRLTANPAFKAAYCNNLGDLIKSYRIDLWIHGHIHTRADYCANGVRVVCNPRGYDGYQLVEGFDMGRVISLD